MLVDDEPDLLLPLLRGLNSRRLRVEGFTNALDALNVFQPGKYNLALVDVSMAEMSGFELARKLQRRDGKIKICFLTGWPHFKTTYETEFPDLGPERFLMKPISIATLEKFIQTQLSKEEESWDEERDSFESINR